MAAVPVVLNGVMVPKNRAAGDQPVPCVITGYLSIQGLEVGGGPIIPDNPPPGGGDPPHIDNTLPIPPEPIDPPPSNAPPNAVLVVKPAPVTGGWGMAVDEGKIKWFYAPSESGAGPKR